MIAVIYFIFVKFRKHCRPIIFTRPVRGWGGAGGRRMQCRDGGGRRRGAARGSRQRGGAESPAAAAGGAVRLCPGGWLRPSHNPAGIQSHGNAWYRLVLTCRDMVSHDNGGHGTAMQRYGTQSW